jgi:hypothetical protein
VEQLNPFRFLRRYRGVHISRTWPRGRRHRGRGERSSLRRGRAALRNALGEGNLKGRGAAHTMGEGLVFEVRVPQDLPDKAQNLLSKASKERRRGRVLRECDDVAVHCLNESVLQLRARRGSRGREGRRGPGTKGRCCVRQGSRIPQQRRLFCGHGLSVVAQRTTSLTFALLLCRKSGLHLSTAFFLAIVEDVVQGH